MCLALKECRYVLTPVHRHYRNGQQNRLIVTPHTNVEGSAEMLRLPSCQSQIAVNGSVEAIAASVVFSPPVATSCAACFPLQPAALAKTMATMAPVSATAPAAMPVAAIAMCQNNAGRCGCSGRRCACRGSGRHAGGNCCVGCRCGGESGSCYNRHCHEVGLVDHDFSFRSLVILPDPLISTLPNPT